MMLIQRQILPYVEKTISEYPVTLITGARQVGKTTLVTMIEKKHGYTYFSFDDTDLMKEAKENPKLFLKTHPAPVIFDEIQRVPELFLEIEASVNKIRREQGSIAANGMYLLTGSQKYRLMKGVSESLSGRVGIIELPPLSQAEIRNYSSHVFEVEAELLSKLSEERSLSEEELYDSILRGFYPARWEIEGMPIKNFYSNYVKTYVERDVSQLINLRDQMKFENFIKVIASMTGEEFIADNIAKTIGVDKNTVVSWVSILLTSDLISLLPSYYEDSINKRIVKRKKLYVNDTGLACFLLGIDSVKALKQSSFKGRMIETYIHNEIRKGYLNAGEEIDSKLFFYRDNNQNEIDLILLRDGELNLIEYKAGKNISKAAVKSFSQLKGSKYDQKGGCVICLTDDPVRIEAGIYAYPIRCL